MKYRPFIYSSVIVLLISAFVACTPESCLEATVATVKAGLYETGTGKEITADSITLFGLGKEQAMIYNKTADLQSFSFPLDARKDTSIFLLRINGINDTITLIYSSYPHLISKECGFTFYHRLDTVFNTREDADILKINQNITTINEENIRIFY